VTDPLGPRDHDGLPSRGPSDAVTGCDGHTITTSYDAVDRPTKVTYADGTFSSTGYD
jgi:YD repeat-containing protein